MTGQENQLTKNVFRDDIKPELFPKVSVLMSVYNPCDSKVFYDAVQSIIDQTFTDWEMILCDDGSDAKYRAIVDKAAAMDSRIILIRNMHNRGVARSMNRCIRYSNGEYLARMDADDISKPERFEKMVDFLDHNLQYEWVGSNTDLINDDGVWGHREMPEHPDKQDFLAFSPYIHPSVMFRRSVLIHNKRYTSSIRGEDYELFMRLHSKEYHGYNIQENLFQYREDKGNYHRRRRIRTQLEETRIRARGFRRLGILNPRTMIYVIKPLILGMIPDNMQVRIKSLIRNE